MFTQALEIGVLRHASADRFSQGVCCRNIRYRRNPLKSLSDDIFRFDWGTKNLTCNFRNHLIALSQRTLGRHGGRGTDTQQIAVETLAYPANQHRNISTLTPAVGMKLIKHKELQAICCPHDRAILLTLTSHQQFEHYEVCEDDVGRIHAHPLALLGLFLARITTVGHWALAICVAGQKLL
ncbi:Uncharacterised protein [Streptococcus pneumoniae]|nr:Uncharacterised protein [Streptococcus pneumoniae]